MNFDDGRFTSLADLAKEAHRLGRMPGEKCEKRVKVVRVLVVMSTPDRSPVTNDESNPATQS
jgi:hypothetical protein